MLCGESFLNAHAVVLFGKLKVFYGNIYRLLKTALFTSYKTTFKYKWEITITNEAKVKHFSTLLMSESL